MRTPIPIHPIQERRRPRVHQRDWPRVHQRDWPRVHQRDRPPGMRRPRVQERRRPPGMRSPRSPGPVEPCLGRGAGPSGADVLQVVPADPTSSPTCGAWVGWCRIVRLALAMGRSPWISRHVGLFFCGEALRKAPFLSRIAAAQQSIGHGKDSTWQVQRKTESKICAKQRP